MMPIANIQRGHGLVGADRTSLTGSLLVASPALSGSIFAQSVIYLCAHSPEDGAMGLIVNKRVAQPSLDDLLEQLDINPRPPKRRVSVCLGGPLDPSRGFVLHSSDWSGDGSLPAGGDICLTASLEVLRDMAEGSGPQNALLALGHASWDAGQLEEEMIRDSAWLSVPATDALVFGQDHSFKWRQALASVGIDPVSVPDAVGHA